MFQHLNTFLILALMLMIHSSQSIPAGNVSNGQDKSRAMIHSRSATSSKVISTCRDSGTFALTFDDGPYIYENEVSDFLSSRGIHGTFFINGYNYDCIYDQNIVDQLKHTFSQGHLIGSHTWSHPDITTLSAADFNIQLDLVETAMKKILGVKPRYFRPPYAEDTKSLPGHSTRVTRPERPLPPPTKLMMKYLNLSPTPQIALNHETHQTTASEVSQHAVQVLQKAGYRLVSVSECLGSGRTRDDYYQYVGEPEQRDSSWTCNGTPKPSA
ncbi:family 4 carbohydrate esterase [Melampsora americana]|nr:family 4 carbohydrate esterase [Melampsora americana]